MADLSLPPAPCPVAAHCYPGSGHWLMGGECVACICDERDRLKAEAKLWRDAHGAQTAKRFDDMVAERDAALAQLAKYAEAAKAAWEYAKCTGQERIPVNCWMLLARFGVLIEETEATTPAREHA